VKVGDLVKYSEELSGLGTCLGIVIGVSGKAVDVQWFDPHSMGREFSCEIPDFLEVVSETR
jgi:hypothetical protein|tara:strand:- start:3444 stop:3626 length:183 start_codon:yes stop_codon:yes gene_type:complete